MQTSRLRRSVGNEALGMLTVHVYVFQIHTVDVRMCDQAELLRFSYKFGY
jgi:hypothetical protein